MKSEMDGLHAPPPAAKRGCGRSCLGCFAVLAGFVLAFCAGWCLNEWEHSDRDLGLTAISIQARGLDLWDYLYDNLVTPPPLAPPADRPAVDDPAVGSSRDGFDPMLPSDSGATPLQAEVEIALPPPTMPPLEPPLETTPDAAEGVAGAGASGRTDRAAPDDWSLGIRATGRQLVGEGDALVAEATALRNGSRKQTLLRQAEAKYLAALERYEEIRARRIPLPGLDREVQYAGRQLAQSKRMQTLR